MPREPLYELFAHQRPIHYKKGQIIIRDDETPQGVYLIKTGYIRIYNLANNGSEDTHCVLKPPELFPLSWIMNGHQNYYHEAWTDAELLRVPKTEILHSVQTNQEVAIGLLRQFSKRLNIYQGRLNNFQFDSAYKRVICRLLFLSQRFGESQAAGKVITVPFTHELIANSINISRETMSRQFEILKNKGLVAYFNHRIIIIDVKKLKKELL